MIDVLLILLAIALIPAALVGLAVGLGALGFGIGLPVAWVLDEVESRKRRKLAKAHREKMEARRNQF